MVPSVATLARDGIAMLMVGISSLTMLTTNDAANDYRMYFVTNHDENSWNGTVYERFGEAYPAFATLAFTIDGMPLVYSGQEAGLN